MIDKWLKAGIMENGQVSYPNEGTPQGGSISPLISNVFLHYALDEWFRELVQPLLKGESFIIRFAVLDLKVSKDMGLLKQKFANE